MGNDARIKVALAGKPNSGKSSLFNHLTGLNQKIGNYPGVTVDKRIGLCSLGNETKAEITDLPGIYSLYPRTSDERIVTEIFTDRLSPYYPDRVVVVTDATNLKSSFLLLTQLIDMGLPIVLVLNMVDLAAKSGQSIDVEQLSQRLNLPVVLINSRTGQGIDQLKETLSKPLQASSLQIYPLAAEVKEAVTIIKEHFRLENDYIGYQLMQQGDTLAHLNPEEKRFIKEIARDHQFFLGKYQGAETIYRYGFIQDLLKFIIISHPDPDWKKRSYQVDRLITHPVAGYAIFLALLFIIFQSIFAWAQVPMDFIDQTFTTFSTWMKENLPDGPLFDLISQGIVPGIGGIIIFVPQIAILFGFISILEESGYMARVVFLMDKIMRKFGMNGRSVVPLISGWACAIPAIMATRTIENWKERIITIFVTPFMSCSARLPVYAILIALVIPADYVLGVLNLQGLVLMGLYLLGFFAAMLSAWVMKILVKSKERSYLIMELPTYKMPKWSNVGYTLVEKTKTFVFEAGKVILAISIVLWGLASFGPGDSFQRASVQAREEAIAQNWDTEELQNREASLQLEHSYAGIIGKAIEPIITPLGYDWKIGIALIASFAAREVFVGTMATIYSLGSTDDPTTIMNRLKNEVNPDTGSPRFNLAVGLSLLIFYTLAMQCMSTLAVVKRETRGWKWPILQFVYMTVVAYLSSMIAYQLLA